jgi:hypothetical protein
MWIDFHDADFPNFSQHIEGLILLLRAYHANLYNQPVHPLIYYVSRLSVATDACIGFFGDKQRFPSELIPRDNSWTKQFLHPTDMPRVLVEFSRAEWMRQISSFRRWTVVQRGQADYEDPFVEEAIARQGATLASQITAWANHIIPAVDKVDDTPTFNSGYGESYSQMSVDLFNLPRAQFADTCHNEMTLTYYGLLLLVSYTTYPHGGHLPYPRGTIAVKFCQSFASFSDSGEMDIVNQLLHLFFARLTFDESFPQGIFLCFWLMKSGDGAMINGRG